MHTSKHTCVCINIQSMGHEVCMCVNQHITHGGHTTRSKVLLPPGPVVKKAYILTTVSFYSLSHKTTAKIVLLNLISLRGAATYYDI